MGSRLGRRVVHFTNLPIKLLMPNTFQNIKEISLKTIPSASKIEIKRVLESLYGFEVDKVRTLNMEGKKKKRGGLLIAKPDYKKAYVTLKSPLSLSRDLFPIRVIQDEKERLRKEKESSIVEEGKKHWLDGKEVNNERNFKKKGGFDDVASASAAVKFPWSSMKHRQRNTPFASNLLIKPIICFHCSSNLRHQSCASTKSAATSTALDSIVYFP